MSVRTLYKLEWQVLILERTCLVGAGNEPRATQLCGPSDLHTRFWDLAMLRSSQTPNTFFYVRLTVIFFSHGLDLNPRQLRCHHRGPLYCKEALPTELPWPQHLLMPFHSFISEKDSNSQVSNFFNALIPFSNFSHVWKKTFFMLEKTFNSWLRHLFLMSTQFSATLWKKTLPMHLNVRNVPLCQTLAKDFMLSYLVLSNDSNIPYK